MRSDTSNPATLVAGAAFLAAALLAIPAGAQEAGSATTGAFRDLTVFATLQRGKTDKAQVRQLLGIPNGTGAAAASSLAGGEREIWYYEDLELTGAKAEKRLVTMQMRQQIMLVFFKGEIVDGYLWTSNAGAMSAAH